MTHDLPIPRQDDRSDGTSIVEWGTEDEAPAGGRLRRAFAGLGRDHRVPMLLAGLGAVAALASLLGEWVTLSIPTGGSDPSNPLEVTNGVAEIGAMGTGYLVGLLALGCAVALALRGTRAVRVNARVAGVALAAGTLALLAATVSSLDDSARRGIMLYSGEDGFRTEHGRGLFMAFAAVLLFAAALVRIAPASVAEVEPTGEPAGPDDASPEPDGRRRRTRRRAEDADPDEGRPPADITVTSTVPFAREAPPD